MNDHINISEPCIDSRYYHMQLQIEQKNAELAHKGLIIAGLTSDLDAIFERIGRGDISELHYKNGDVIEIENRKCGAYQDAVRLAEILNKKHFPENILWEPLDTTAGVITQIDNMTCKLVMSTEEEHPQI